MCDFNLLQLTDTHLFADPDGALCGQNTRISLEAVVRDVRDGDVRPDAVLVTGDLSQDGTVRSYENLAALLAPLDCPAFCLPGNHDDPAVMERAYAGGSVQIGRLERFGAWSAVLLNSAVPGSTGGRLSKDELRFLDRSLAERRPDPCLVALHHQPVPVGSRWLDAMMVDNGDDLFETLAAHDHVKAIAWGHVHQAFDGDRNGIKLIATPSTSVQFAPGRADFQFDRVAPGYRWIALGGDGSLTTRVVRLRRFQATVDFSRTGY